MPRRPCRPIESIDSETDHDTVLVRFNFGAKVDVRTFREDNSFVVDVESAERKAAPEEAVRSDELSSLAAELAAAQSAAEQGAGAADGAGAGRPRLRPNADHRAATAAPHTAEAAPQPQPCPAAAAPQPPGFAPPESAPQPPPPAG